MKIYKLLSILLLLIICSGCMKYPADFWNQTTSAVEKWYVTFLDKNEKWHIEVQDKDLARDPNHREVNVRYIENIYPREEVSFGFRNRGNEYIVYQYEKKVDEHINLHYTSAYHHKVEICSTDSEFKKYKVTYTMDEYRNEVLFDSKSMKGNIEILSDGTIHYDLVPYLASSIDSLNKMLDEFEEDFKIDYEMFEFVHLPKLMKDLYIPEKTEVDETETTFNYYSEDEINAKGYRIITFVKILDDYSMIQYGNYCIEQASYGFKYDVQLTPRKIENCYNILLDDVPEKQYAIYIQDDVAYLYLQSDTDEFILNDIINNNAENAKYILYKGERDF